MKIVYCFREIRLSKNMTLDKLEMLTLVSRAHLSDLENNKKQATILVAEKIAKALKVKITDLYKKID